jgi:hypothetical protein
MNYCDTPKAHTGTSNIPSNPNPVSRPIPERIARIQKGTSHLHDALSDLESRLSAVAPEGPTVAEPSLTDKDRGPSCEMEAQLWDVEGAVSAAICRVANLLSRLKL